MMWVRGWQWITWILTVGGIEGQKGGRERVVSDRGRLEQE